MLLKQRVARLRELIDSYPFDVAFRARDREEFGELTGVICREVWRRENVKFPNDTRHVHVLAYDWTTPQQFSWRNAAQIANSKNPVETVRSQQRQKRQHALRFAVRFDMQEFKMSVENPRCCGCGGTDNLTVDHHKTPFSYISELFLQRFPDFRMRPVRGGGDCIADIEVEAEWIAFHASMASYQLLCRYCNSAKGIQ